MKNYSNYLKFMLLMILFSVVMACSDDDDEVLDDEELAFNIKVMSSASFGDILVNQNGQTIYFFAGDVTGESNCSGGCADVWPIVSGEVNDLALSNGLYASDFKAIVREDGETQLTFKGWPLYYFSPEGDGVLEPTGDIQGDGKGGAFFVAKPDYTIMLGRQTINGGDDQTAYIVDGLGVSLYDFTNDEANVSNCSGGCAEAWPPFNTEDMILPSILSANDFDSFQREDGLGYQVTFKGNPLYYFNNDNKTRGNVLGEGGANGQFFVVKPSL